MKVSELKGCKVKIIPGSYYWENENGIRYDRKLLTKEKYTGLVTEVGTGREVSISVVVGNDPEGNDVDIYDFTPEELRLETGELVNDAIAEWDWQNV